MSCQALREAEKPALMETGLAYEYIYCRKRYIDAAASKPNFSFVQHSNSTH